MKLSVIILNYNVRYFLEQCILSVQKALEGIDGEIIVVDNASSDDSCEMMKTKFPHIKCIENSTNLGFPKGNNIGVAQAKGEYICILNPDTVLAEDTFSKIFNSQFVTHNSQLGIIGCKLIDGSGNFLPESKRGVPTPWVSFTKIFGLYKLFPNLSWFNSYYAQHLSENESGEVSILVGAFMIMKREVYVSLGGFDENCFMYSDDIDLSYLAIKSGKKNYYFADTTIIHYKGESTIRDGMYMKRFREAMHFFYKKHFKKSLFFDVMMKIGTVLFSFFKKFQQQNEKRKIDKYVVFSSQPHLNILNIEKDKVIYKTDFKQFKNDITKKIEVVFDVSSYDFKSIIHFMETNNFKNISFKNYFSGSNYMIGSLNSNDKGEVKKIK